MKEIEEKVEAREYGRVRIEVKCIKACFLTKIFPNF